MPHRTRRCPSGSPHLAMDTARTSLTCFLVILLIAVKSGDGMKCWACSSDRDSRCADPFNQTHLALMDCDRGKASSPYMREMAFCKKMKQRVNDELIIIRSCVWQQDEYTNNGPCSSDSVNSYAKIEYCSTCSTDGCNAGETLRATVRGLGPLVAAILISRHFTH